MREHKRQNGKLTTKVAGSLGAACAALSSAASSISACERCLRPEKIKHKSDLRPILEKILSE